MGRQGHQLDAMAVLDNIPVGVVVQDADARILYANHAASRTLGLTLDELLGVTSYDERWHLFDSDGSPIAREDAPVPVAIATKQAVRNRVLGVHRPREDDRVWLQVTAVPEFDDDGEIARVLCTFEDISAPQEALRHSENLYSSVIRAMSEGVVVHERDSSIRMANPAAERVLGLSVEQMSGRTPLDPRWKLLLPDGSPLPAELIPSEITRKTGRAVTDFLLRCHRPNGDQTWLSVSTDPFDEGGPDGFGTVATFADVTNEREAVLALQRSQEQLERVLAAVPGVIYQYVRTDDGQERFEFASARAQEILGASAEALVANASNAWDRIHPDDREVMESSIEESRRTVDTWECEFRMRQDDGTYRWVSARAIVERLQDSVCWTGVGIDITAARLLQEQVQRAQQREAMGDLAAGVAHNFNNMLAAILPNIELVAEECDPRLRPLLLDARKAARSASDLVRQLLALTRRDADSRKPKAVDLVPLVSESLTICERTFDRSIAIRSHLDASAAHVLVRPSDLQQVIVNLCLNSRDALAGVAAPEIRVSLTIVVGASASDSGEGRFAELRVQDNGSGMPESVRRRLGEPFFTTKEPGKGTGLGLATAYRTVQDVGGTIACDSHPGAGTTFVIRLPLAEATTERVSSDRIPAVVRTGRVLVVEDEELVRRGVCRCLSRVGLESVEVERGDAAIALVDELVNGSDGAGLSAVILDLSLPGMPGGQVLASIRRRHQSLPVLVMSGHVHPGVDLSGADRVLQKPVSLGELERALEELIPPGVIVT